ncbi:unnamed protein product [Citrullus colocynthis]|uniref:Uncharacterized protein n=1 Tax=Citrullus colocynthis TaxID=252529 RepID=A0ABP0YZY5_9ROSI
MMRLAPIVESHLVVEDVNESVASPLDAIIINDNLRRSSWVSKPPSYLQKYHCGFLLDQAVSFTSKFSLQHYISYDRLSPDFRHFVLSISSTFEPQYYHQTKLFLMLIDVKPWMMNYKLWS